MSDSAVLVRQFAPGDTAYVFSTWLRDLRDADASGLPDDLWFPAHRALIERFLADAETEMLVASAADQPDEILGYIVARPEELLWLHVRKGFLREQGLASQLLSSLARPLPDPAPVRWTTPLARTRLRVLFRSRALRRGQPAPKP